jgi:hypothetical protein
MTIRTQSRGQLAPRPIPKATRAMAFLGRDGLRWSSPVAHRRTGDLVFYPVAAAGLGYGLYRLGAYIVHGVGAGGVVHAFALQRGDFPQIITGVAVMSIYVVGANRLFWRRLYRLASERYSF